MRSLFAAAALALAVSGPAPAAQPARAALLAPVAGVPLDPVDLVRAENPEQAFALELTTTTGATVVPEGTEIRFRVTSARAGHLTLVAQDEGGVVTVLYPNRFAPGARLGADVAALVPAAREFRLVARAPFGRLVVKALVTPEPLVRADIAHEAWRSVRMIQVEGPPPTDAGSRLGGLDGAVWGTASLALTLVRTRATGAPPALPPAPQAAYQPEAPLTEWRRRYGEVAGEPARVKSWGAFPAAPAHDRSIVVVYRPQAGTRSFGAPAGGPGLFGRVRIVDPEHDGIDGSGTRSLHRSFGAGFDEVLAGLNADPDVLAAVPNVSFRTLGWRSAMPVAPDRPAEAQTPEYWETQWGLHNPFFRTPSERLDVAWRAALAQYRAPDRPVVVAVLDTGVRFDNPHLAPILWRNPLEVPENGRDDDGNGFVDDVRGWDAVDGDGDPTDPSADESHGTFVASQIGGAGGAIQSIAPDVRILPVRVLDADGGGSLRQLIEGVRYAAQNGARVVNLSFGMAPLAEPAPRIEAVLSALFAEADRLGVLVVVAAGNHGADTRTSATYPAGIRAPNVISAAALTITGDLAAFSNRGPGVDVAAPGEAIVSHPGRGRAVGAFDGTSMAAPFVSGLAALVFAQHPTWTPAQVRAAIVGTVRSIPGLDVGAGGLIDAAAALAADGQ